MENDIQAFDKFFPQYTQDPDYLADRVTGRLGAEEIKSVSEELTGDNSLLRGIRLVQSLPSSTVNVLMDMNYGKIENEHEPQKADVPLDSTAEVS